MDGEYVRFDLHTESNGDEWSRSEVLGVDFYHRIEDGISWFLLKDSATSEWLGDAGEEREARLEAEARLAESEARLSEQEAPVAGTGSAQSGTGSGVGAAAPSIPSLTDDGLFAILLSAICR